MRIVTALFAIVLSSISPAAFGQDGDDVYTRKIHVRGYLTAGWLSSGVTHKNPTSGASTLFKASGVSQPLFGAGGIFESKTGKARMYFGAGLSYNRFDYGGERYVRIISPSQEELEVYEAQHRIINIDLFLGRYLYLGEYWSVKPQLGLSGQVVSNSQLDIRVYDYQDGSFKRDYQYKPKRDFNLVPSVSMFLSYKKTIEAGPVYVAPVSYLLSLYNKSTVSSFGVAVRYIHTF